MDRQDIARIIFNCSRILEDEKEKALATLKTEIRRAYTYSGLYRNMDAKKFSAEVDVAADAILYDLQADRRYHSLRTEEIPLLFIEGYRGTFGNESTYLTPITFMRWIEAYMVHETRRSALDSATRERSRIEASGRPDSSR